MDEILFIAFLVFLFLGIPVGIGLLLYFVSKRFGYPKSGKYLTIIYSLVVFAVVALVVFEDEFFSGNDAKELVQEQGIILSDHFILKNNESMWAIGDYYHSFTLTISEEDKINAINNIRKSENFKPLGQPISDLYFENEDRYNGKKRTQKYETEKSFVTEYLQPNGEGYAPTYRRISVSKDKDELVFEDIDY